MSKPKTLGVQKPYVPNNRMDYRNRKRGRNPADRVKMVGPVSIPRKKEAGHES